jgi:hypothetical protein
MKLGNLRRLESLGNVGSIEDASVHALRDSKLYSGIMTIDGCSLRVGMEDRYGAVFVFYASGKFNELCFNSKCRNLAYKHIRDSHDSRGAMVGLSLLRPGFKGIVRSIKGRTIESLYKWPR